jgi:glycosyltransferase involved in cell wall biosynthesis
MRKPLLNVLWHQTALPRWCRRQKYDVLFLPAGNRRLPISVPCPTVGTVHDFSSIHVKGKYDPFRVFYITRVLPFLIKRLTRILTVSESSKRDIVEYAGIPEDRIRVTPLAADTRIFHPRDPQASRDAVCAKHGIRPPYILYISRIEHPGKNHAKLIEAFSRMKAAEDLPHTLVLAGSDWVRAEEVHAVAAASPSARDIHFTGFFPSADLPELLSGCELFVFPSLYEGFGLPVLEAMTSGVPTACADTSSLPEVAGDGALLFPPEDVDAMADAMKRMLVDEGLRRDFVRKGLERSRGFTWEETARRTLEVILEAAQAGGER